MRSRFGRGFERVEILAVNVRCFLLVMSLQRSRIEARSSSLDAQMAHRSARPAMCHLPVCWSAEAKNTGESCGANHTLFARKTPSSCALSPSRRVCSLAADDGSVTWHRGRRADLRAEDQAPNPGLRAVWWCIESLTYAGTVEPMGSGKANSC
jgi:hypothetical protein